MRILFPLAAFLLSINSLYRFMQILNAISNLHKTFLPMQVLMSFFAFDRRQNYLRITLSVTVLPFV